MNRFIASLLIAAIIPLFGACGMTGGTTARKVRLNPAITGSSLNKSVAVGMVSACPGAGVNHAIGTYNIGKFGESDVSTLRHTLELSLPNPDRTDFSVHVIVQHFALAFTNNRGANLAIVDWCVADDKGVRGSERFYAAYDTGDKLLGIETMGMAKSRVIHAIAKRIDERALAIANSLPLPPAPSLTFDDPASANHTLPTHMEAASNGLALAALQQTMLGGLSGVAEMMPSAPIPPTDWTALLVAGKAP
ncbi:MAG: hypothetical protein WC205_02355 [Opitutaceae bacterium]|jgi:hypothetical protein